MTEVLRVVIIDEQPLFRDGVAAALLTAFKKAIVEHGSGSKDALQQALNLDPHILLLGLSDPSEAVEATQAVTTRCPSVKVIYFTNPGGEHAIHDVLRAGARGCVSKIVTGVELVRCIQAVHVGESYVSPALAARLLGQSSKRTPSVMRDDFLTPLTGREQKIMQEVALGLTNKEIAIKLLLSDNTVKRYMTQIMQKLHVRNRLEAVLLLRKKGMLGSNKEFGTYQER